MEDDTKDYVINLRVSKQTYEKIKNKARQNKDTISSLLRGIIDDSAEILSDLSNDLKGGKPGAKFNDVVSYHRGMLAQERLCDNCGVHMVKGETTTIGDTDKGKSYFFCARCK
jgi:formamidopyrimidine-DNA glycosylase